MERWYTLHSKPNAEYRVASVLQQRGIQTYLPEIEASKISRQQEKKPFFPCYLFCKVDFEAVDLSVIQWTPGLRRIVAFSGEPAFVPDKVIELIRYKLDEIEAQAGLPDHPFKPGDTVRITEGPFRDMVAIFEGPSTPARRVQVLLDILGHASRVQLDVIDLEETSSEARTQMPKRPRRTRGRGRRIK